MVVDAVFGGDEEWIKHEFTKHFAREIVAFGECWAQGFRSFKDFEIAGPINEKTAAVAGCIASALDDLLTSMKLLVAGKLPTSGNSLRQAAEWIAVSMLCASKGVVLCGPQNRPVDYWESFKKQDEITEANRAIKQLEKNREALGVDETLVALLKSFQESNHENSHPSMRALWYRLCPNEPGLLFVGGGFDEGKLSTYRREIAGRIDLCSNIPRVIQLLQICLSVSRPNGKIENV